MNLKDIVSLFVILTAIAFYSGIGIYLLDLYKASLSKPQFNTLRTVLLLILIFTVIVFLFADGEFHSDDLAQLVENMSIEIFGATATLILVTYLGQGLVESRTPKQHDQNAETNNKLQLLEEKIDQTLKLLQTKKP